jgi:hypothetical protein
VATLKDARAAKTKATKLLEDHPLLQGIGITKQGADYGLKVNLLEGDAGAVPDDVDGVPVQVEVVGPVRPQD